MSRDPVRSRLSNQAGMTLVEVVVFMTLTIVVLVALVATFLAGIRAQAVTRSRNAATAAANLVTSSLSSQVRASSAVSMTGDVVALHHASGTDGWECNYWWFDGTSIQSANSATKLVDPIATATWQTIAGTGGPGQDEQLVGVTGNLAGGQGFATGTGGLEYDFTVTSGEVELRVSGAAIPATFGPVNEGSPTSC